MATLSQSDLSQLTRAPVVRQLGLLLGLAFAIALGLWGFRWSQAPEEVPVISGLGDAEAAEVAETLRSQGIPFRLDLAQGSIRVPAAQVDNARLQLAAKGLPRGAGTGYEMMQDSGGIGASQFLENARYQHALETELARTIQALQPVRAARVHLAIPRPSAFARSQSAPTASVLIDLHPGGGLERRQVSAIVHLVAASVPGMTAGQVAVIDHAGRLLSQQGDDAMARNSDRLDYTRQLEAEYQRRVLDLLQPVLGAGRFRVQVSTDLDWTVTEEARESYAPESSTVRSERVQEELREAGAAAAAVGVPGAMSNQPPETAGPAAVEDAAATPPMDRMSRRSERQFEIDRVLSHRRQGGAQLRKLTVAVVVDHVPRTQIENETPKTVLVALSEAELAEVEALVREAVGFDAGRGDRLSVKNMAFAPVEIPEVEVLPLWQQPQALSLARQAAGVILGLVLLFVVIRPTLRSIMRPVTALPAAAPGAGAAAALGQVVPAGEGPAAASMPQAIARLDFEDKVQAARSAVAQDPKRVAQVVKTWINRDGA
jgi:flagellar M-ring protein FliF